RPFLSHGQTLRRVANSQDGKWLVAADPAGGLHVYDLSAGAELGQLANVPSRRSQISLEPTGRFIAGAFGINGVRLWNFSTRQVIHEIVGADDPVTHDASGVVFKPDGSEFVTMTSQGLLQRWSTSNGTAIGR